MEIYDDDGDLIIEVPDDDEDDDEVRNAVRVRQPGRYHNYGRRRRTRTQPAYRPSYRRTYRPQPRAPKPVVVRPTPAPAPAPVVVKQPTVEKTPEYGLSLGGVKLGMGTVAGTLLTLAGLAAQVGSHFVEQPKVVEPADDLSANDLAVYEEERRTAERKSRLLETFGRGLSDVGQLAALKG